MPTPRRDLDSRDAEIAQLRAAIDRALDVVTTAFQHANGNRGVTDLACDVRLVLAPRAGRK